MTREITYALMDPTGNVTLLAETPVDPAEQPAAAARLMALEPAAEQVGFIAPAREADLALRMAGGEFCGNASMSAAVLAAMDAGMTTGRLRIAVSGAEEPVAVSVERTAGAWRGTVTMPLPRSVSEEALRGGSAFPVVRFDGIAHVILEQRPDRAAAEALAPPWCRQLDAKALGLMFLDRTAGTMTPLVYVPAAGTLFWESSCASGSAAAGAWLAVRADGPVTASLRQPGGALTVTAAPGGEITLAGTVRLLRRRTVTVEI